MTYQPEAIRIADGLDQNVLINPQTSEDEPGGYRSELDELMAHAAAILRSQHARIADLEAQLYAAPQPTENLRCKSTQKRLATLWGYEKPQHRQPLTNEQIIAIADNARAAESGDAGYILPIAFARAIEAAYGITGGQQ